jgi:diketogulonate reductase-like aldo/keto reductase
MVDERPATGETTLPLRGGGEIPMLGLGVWQIPDGRPCVDAVRWALELGYRHVDTAQAYGNERSVGTALHQAGIPRDDVFVTTKFHPGGRDPAAALDGSLRRLDLDYVDLYIVHWPGGGAIWMWPGMERTLELGRARSIGVSNYGTAELEQVIASARHAPVLDQVQFSPFEYRRGLLEACRRDDVVLEAYSPLGTGRHLADRTVRRVAERVGRTPGQVLLRWCLEHRVPVLTKSTHRERLEENFGSLDFRLSDDDVRELDALDRTRGTERARERTWW